MSEITNRLRAFLPATFEAMTSASYIGDAGMAKIVETVKFRLFATVVLPDDEDTTYDAFSLDYAAKIAALRVIPAGADYWSDQLTGETTNEEVISYPDRVESLWKIHERLLTEVKQDQPYFEALHPGGLRRAAQVPRVSTTGDLLTPDPADFGYGSTKRGFGRKTAVLLPWSPWGDL